MKQLYAGKLASVYHAEVKEWAGHAPFDVTITDPPYTAYVQGNIRSCATNGKLKVRAWKPGFEPLADYAHVPLLLALSRRWCLAFCALEQFGEYERAAGGQRKGKRGCYVRSGIWRKKQAAPQLSGDRPANSCEGVAVMHPRCSGRMRWNGQGKHAYWVHGEDELFLEHGRERAEKRHAAQKPDTLMRELVSLFSEEEETVFDPYAGSGATGAAALALGRRVVLADNDLAWAEFCAERMEKLGG